VLLLAAVAVNAFLSAFGGTWQCSERLPGVASVPVSTWTIAAAPDSAWVVVHRIGRGAGGTAFVGYLPAEQRWMYEDFHSDGSFTTSTSSGPQNGTWTWEGEYATPQRVVHGAMQWRRDRSGFRQGFGRLLGPSFRESAFAACRPAGPKP
jgi:hypothetical protein